MNKPYAEWTPEQKKKAIERAERWQKENPEKKKAAAARYNKNNPEKLQEYRMRLADKWVTFLKKLGYNSCAVCGYNKCWAALDFHHIDPATKEMGISDWCKSHSLSKENKATAKAEVAKCVMLCANCHRELHHNA